MKSPTCRTVGSRELKTRLGAYLRQVRAGATLVVTDRGRPVAELRPLSLEGEGLEARLYELAARGVIGDEVAERVPLEAFEPVVSHGGSLSEAIREDREDRF
ncbi:MAG: type II toxin-antitoxin system prevent-host-death family antitoxin [bacterium]|nr:type II toxin-antitoxin system prevent-host-death family antitoxin [bacterium]